MKLYEITLMARKGKDFSYQLWLANALEYVPRIQETLRETGWERNRYWGVKVTRVK